MSKKDNKTQQDLVKKIPDNESSQQFHAPNTSNFKMVGIGASAGGLEAVSSLLKNIPENIGLAFILVQHLAPEHVSMLSELLSRITSLKVVEITDGLRVVPNTVYVIPPNSNLGIINGVLQLIPRSEKQHLPIDYFFTCLAKDQKSNVIGVILSGSASDGTRGLRAIKAEQGITFAQLPETARYDSMPTSAINSGCVDFILSPEDIAKELAYLATHANAVRLQPGGGDSSRSNTNEFEKIFMLLRNRTGNDFSLYKQSTIQRRVSRRMLVNRIEQLSDYVKYLNTQPAEIDALFEDILINVTAFFRDAEAFEMLKNKVFPIIFQDRDSNLPVRIWIPGCSTGEEVYSILICLLEYLNDDFGSTKIQVFASDIDDKAIEKARAGIYSEETVSDVSRERLSRFFNKVPNGYQINQRVRELCVFATQNIIKDPPFSHLDLAVCRNMLIYMNNILQRKVLQTLHYSLRNGGILFLGNSETIGSSADIFTPINNGHKFYLKKEIPQNARNRAISLMADQPLTRVVSEKSNLVQAQSVNLQQFAESIILSKYSPPGIVVNQQLDTLQFIGNTGRYMEPSPGNASLNVIKLIHPDLTAELRLAMHQAVNSNSMARAENVCLHRDGVIENLTIEVLPLKIRPEGEIYFLIMFCKKDEYNPDLDPDNKLNEASLDLDMKESVYIRKLKQEQDISKAYMQAIIEDHESSNEELQAANEEIQSTNEELQSTNEELETAKEELQSTNEELITVNEELENRNRELQTSNDDLKNIITSTNLAVVMLNEKYCIRFFSPRAHSILNLIDSDIGRPISDIRANVNTGDLTQYISEVLETLHPKSMEVTDNNNHWYSMSIRPYRTEDNHISGTVILFTDITESKQLQRASRLATIVDDSNDAIMILNFKGDILQWNRRSTEIFGYQESEAIGKNITMLIPAEEKHELSDIFTNLQQGKSVEPFKTQRLNKNGKIIRVNSTMSALNNDQGMPFAIALTERILDNSSAS